MVNATIRARTERFKTLLYYPLFQPDFSHNSDFRENKVIWQGRDSNPELQLGKSLS